MELNITPDDPEPLSQDDLECLATAAQGTDTELDVLLDDLGLNGRPEYDVRQALRLSRNIWQCESCEVWIKGKECAECGRKRERDSVAPQRTGEVLLDEDGCPLFFHYRITGSETLPYIRDVIVAAWEDADADQAAYTALRYWLHHRHSKNRKLKTLARKARNAFVLVCLRALQIVATESGWDCGWGGDDNGDKIDICIEALFDAVESRMPPFDDGIEICELDDWNDYYKKPKSRHQQLLSWRDIELIKLLCRRAIDVEKTVRERKQGQTIEEIDWEDNSRTPATRGRVGHSRQPWELAHERDLLEKSYGRHVRILLDPRFDELPYNRKWNRRCSNLQKFLDKEVPNEIDRRILQLKMTHHRMRCSQIKEIIEGEFGQQISEDTIEKRLNKYLRQWEQWLDPDMKPKRYARGSSKRIELSIDRTA